MTLFIPYLVFNILLTNKKILKKRMKIVNANKPERFKRPLVFDYISGLFGSFW